MDATSPLRTITVNITVLQQGSALVAEIDAAAAARAKHPGTRVAAVRFLSAMPFDRSLGGRWVDLEVDLVLA